MLDLYDVSLSSVKCFVAKSEDYGLWHKHLGHIHFDLRNRVMSKDLVARLRKIKFVNNKLCDDCQKREANSISFKLKYCGLYIYVQDQELLHLDLLGFSRTKSLRDNYYGFLIVDDYLRITWTLF